MRSDWLECLVEYFAAKKLEMIPTFVAAKRNTSKQIKSANILSKDVYSAKKQSEGVCFC